LPHALTVSPAGGSDKGRSAYRGRAGGCRRAASRCL